MFLNSAGLWMGFTKTLATICDIDRLRKRCKLLVSKPDRAFGEAYAPCAGPRQRLVIRPGLPAFAGHGNHCFGFGVATTEASTGWSDVTLDVALDKMAVCAGLFGGISVPAG